MNGENFIEKQLYQINKNLKEKLENFKKGNYEIAKDYLKQLKQSKIKNYIISTARVGDTIEVKMKNGDVVSLYNPSDTFKSHPFSINNKNYDLKSLLNKLNNKESFKENLNFNKWFDTFLDEKNLQHKSWTIKDKNGTDNFINSEVVIESIKNSPSNEQKSIKDMLIKIDFKNGNVMDYFKHLATGLINLRLGESFKEKLRLEDIGEYRYNNFDKILKLFKKMQAYYAKHDSGFYELPFDNWSVTNAETNKNKMSKSDFEDIVLMVESHFNFKIKK